jgi:hypothetical protein
MTDDLVAEHGPVLRATCDRISRTIAALDLDGAASSQYRRVEVRP